MLPGRAASRQFSSPVAWTWPTLEGSGRSRQGTWTATLYQWNPNVTLLRTNVEENTRMGKMMAAAENAATAPVAILLPLKGVSMLDGVSPNGEAGAFWDPETDQACYDAIKGHLKPGIPVIEMDNNINDPAFADKATQLLLDML